MASPIDPSPPPSNPVGFADEPAVAGIEVRGALPVAVSGRLVGVDNGVVHSVHLGAGRVRSYRSHQIRSAVGSEIAAGELFVFGGSILAFGRGSLAHELSSDLEIARPVDLAGRSQVLSACPKHDPVTGDLHLLAVSPDGSQSHVVVSSGALTRRSRLILDAPNEATELAITRDHVVFMCDGFVGVTTRGSEARTAWIATGVDGAVLVETHDLADDIIVYTLTPSLERWTLSVDRSIVHRDVLDPTPRRFARTDDRLLERTPRFLWTVGDRSADTHDLATGRSVHRSLGTRRPGDLAFVADPSRPNDVDGGWLVGFVHDSVDDGADLVVLDAADISGVAVAAVGLSRRIPSELRTTWIPDTDQ